MWWRPVDFERGAIPTQFSVTPDSHRDSRYFTSHVPRGYLAMVSCRGCLVGTPPAPLRNIASTSLRACACVCTACVPRWHPSGAFEYTRRRHLSRHRATDTDWRANDTLRTLHSARANLTQARQPPLSESARFRPTKPDNEGISLYCAQDYNPISGPTSSTNQSSEFRVYSSLE